MSFLKRLKRYNKQQKILLSGSLIFFISLIIILSGSQLGWFSPYDEVTITDKTIRYDWLDVNLFNDPDDNVEFSKGGLKLTEFENEGIFSKDDLEHEIVYKSRATFKFEINAYTDCEIWDIYPGVDTDATMSFTYLTHHWFAWWPFGESWVIYNVHGQHVDLGNVYNPNSYDFDLPITIGIIPDFADLDGEMINGINIGSADYIYQIKVVSVDDVRDGQVGEYHDFYTDVDDPDRLASVDLDGFVDDAITNAFALGKVAEYGLGVDRLGTRDITIQNKKIDTLVQGHQEVYGVSNTPITFNEKM